MCEEPEIPQRPVKLVFPERWLGAYLLLGRKYYNLRIWVGTCVRLYLTPRGGGFPAVPSGRLRSCPTKSWGIVACHLVQSSLQQQTLYCSTRQYLIHQHFLTALTVSGYCSKSSARRRTQAQQKTKWQPSCWTTTSSSRSSISSAASRSCAAASRA